MGRTDGDCLLRFANPSTIAGSATTRFLRTIMARGWPLLLAPNSGRMRSSLPWARAAWAKCIAHTGKHHADEIRRQAAGFWFGEAGGRRGRDGVGFCGDHEQTSDR